MIGAFTRSARLHSGSVVDAPFREDRSLEEIAGDMAPIRADESCAIEDLTEGEWERFERAINE